MFNAISRLRDSSYLKDCNSTFFVFSLFFSCSFDPQNGYHQIPRSVSTIIGKSQYNMTFAIKRVAN